MAHDLVKFQIQKRQRGNEDSQLTALFQEFPNTRQDGRVVLDMFEHVYHDDSITPTPVARFKIVLDTRVVYENIVAPAEPLMKHRSEIGRRLDQAEIVGQGQQAFAQGPYAGPDFDDLAANVGTNHIGDPIVETRHLRDDFEFAGKKSVHGNQKPENCRNGT